MDVLLTAESAKEFSDARRMAFFQGWFRFFTGRPNDLLSFEEVKQNLNLQDSAYKGLQEIELDKIVGSTGRYRDFNRSFLPKNEITEERWRRVDIVAHDQGFPPIEVYNVGDAYFVRDGNHRVSVARLHKTKTIEAYVIEYKTPISINQNDDLDDILDKLDGYLLDTQRRRFYEKTHLDKIRPQHNVQFTEPGRYRLVREHIAFHKYVKEVELGHRIPYKEAVGSWYDNVYLPVLEHIRQSSILKDFPKRTEADLYAWLLLHRAKFEQDLNALGYVPTEDVLESLKRERATNPFAQLMGLFRQKQNLRCFSLKVERAKFLQDTHLNDTQPGHTIKFTEAGCYELALKHIELHKYFSEINSESEMSAEEAAASWYNNVYQPIIQLIQSKDVLKYFPKNTEGDLYIWLVARREAAEEATHTKGQTPDEKIIQDLEAEIESRSLLAYIFGQKLNLQSTLISSQ